MKQIAIFVFTCGFLNGVFAQSGENRAVPSILELLLERDICPSPSPIEVGDVISGRVDRECISQAHIEGIAGLDKDPDSPASYYTFNHAGGELYIDLLSRYPVYEKPFLLLRVGETKTGALADSEINGDQSSEANNPGNGVDRSSHGDAFGSRLIYSDLPNGAYTVEVTMSERDKSGSFTLSIYDDKVTAKRTGRINDTGVQFTGRPNGGFSLMCIDAGGLSGQDCNFGRDNDPVVGRHEPENDLDGDDGFSFLKVSSSGKPLVETAPQWSCLKDNVTGLMWEVKTDSQDNTDLQDKDHIYSWYNPDGSTNGGDPGVQDGGSCNETVSCDTQGYIDEVNSNGLCGYNDWRLPSVAELLGIVRFNDVFRNFTIDGNFFPNTKRILYWTNARYFHSSGTSVRAVDFLYGNVADGDIDGVGVELSRNNASVRLVRGDD